jgi:hypothetical protein
MLFLLPGRDFPADAPPRQTRCVTCGEHHTEFTRVGREVVLIEGTPEGNR